MIKDFQTDLSSKKVLITGASRGIGKAIAMAFAKTGAKLALVSRDNKRLTDACAEIAGGNRNQVYSRALDVSSEQEVVSFIKELKENFGGVDVLVNNAGVYKYSPLALHKSSLWHEIINTNLNSAFYFSSRLVPEMLSKRWGRVINISSISGKHGEAYGAAYSASKFALIGLTQSMALELADKGITVNAICPGWVKTDLACQQLLSEDWCKLNAIELDESLEIARLSVPQQRFIEAQEVAALAVYLATDAARGITGQAINICGGMQL